MLVFADVLYVNVAYSFDAIYLCLLMYDMFHVCLQLLRHLYRIVVNVVSIQTSPGFTFGKLFVQVQTKCMLIGVIRIIMV
jgi:hypothetical protein